MQPQDVNDLTTRLLSGEELSREEQLRLQDWLSSQPEAREAYLADEEMDSHLHCLDRLNSTQDEFVAATIGRLAKGRATDSTKASACKSPKKNVLRWNRVASLVSVAAGLCLLAIGSWLAMRPSTPVEPQPPEVPSPLAFARLASADDAVWDNPHKVGERLEPGTLKLLAGAAVIEFDSGATAKLKAPTAVELENRSFLRVLQGRLAARVPQRATGFTVATPVGRIVDAEAEFHVAVADTGGADVVVEEGRVSFLPQRPGEPSGKAIDLAARALDRVTATLPEIDAPVLPITTAASSSQGGAFAASISANGKTLEFTSREAYESSRSLVFNQLKDSPAEFLQRWSILASMPPVRVGSGTFSRSTTVSENGNTASITHDNSGITISMTKLVDGQPRKTEIKAATPDELQKRDAAAYQLFQRHLGERTAPSNDASTILRDRLQQLRRDNQANRAMQELLDRMLQPLEKNP